VRWRVDMGLVLGMGEVARLGILGKFCFRKIENKSLFFIS